MFPTPTGRARARSARARAQPRLKPLAGLRLGTPAPTQSYRLGVLLRGLRSMRSHCSSSCRLLWRSLLSRLPMLSICLQCLTLSSLTRFPFHDSQVLENALGPTRQQLLCKIRSIILGRPPGGHFRAFLEPFWSQFEPILGDFRASLDRFLSNFGQCLKILEQFWRDFGVLEPDSPKLLDQRG